MSRVVVKDGQGQVLGAVTGPLEAVASDIAEIVHDAVEDGVPKLIIEVSL